MTNCALHQLVSMTPSLFQTDNSVDVRMKHFYYLVAWNNVIECRWLAAVLVACNSRLKKLCLFSCFFPYYKCSTWRVGGLHMFADLDHNNLCLFCMYLPHVPIWHRWTHFTGLARVQCGMCVRC